MIVVTDHTAHERRYSFHLVDAGDGWVLTLTGPAENPYGGYGVRFERVLPDPQQPKRELLRAKASYKGVVRIPDAKLALLGFEDRVALDALLRALPDYPPFKR